MIRSFFYLAFFVTSFSIVLGQSPVRNFDSSQYNSKFYSQFATNKKIPKEIVPQVLTALSFYPELKNTKIIFRLKKRKTPLTSRPRISSVFKRKNKRTYIITISSKTKEHLVPILFSRLPYNAQVGVLGHEVGHIVEYKKKSSLQIIGLSFKLFNTSFVDWFEYNTDKRTIEHGLGYQLLDWSIFVRKTLKIVEWKGASEDLSEGNKPIVNQRYMNPKTIREHIEKYHIYSSLNKEN